MSALRFDGRSGKRPSAEARRYVYRMLAATLKNDLDGNGAGYLYDFEYEPDRRRAERAARAVLAELERKGDS